MRNLLSVPRAAWWCTTLVAVLCVAGLSTPAAAQVDCNSADLQDLIDFVAEVGPGGCGLDIADAAQDITVNDANFDPCDPGFTPGVSTYFENGFDQIRTLVAYSGGNLYLGIRVAGTIGDADGNGDPDNNLCTDNVNIGDEPGIGLSESYSWFIDNDCDGVNEIAITVNNNTVNVSGLSPSGTSFEYSGSDLKVCLTNVSLDPFFRARSFVGHLFDGLGEDLSQFASCPPPTILIDVEKTVEDVCAGQNTPVNVTITNTGDAALDPVDIEDILPAGFSYVGGSSTIGEPGIAGQVLSWSEGPLAPGASLNFTFLITAPEECFGSIDNNIDVSGSFTHPCVNDGQAFLALDSDTYTFQCLPGPCVQLTDTDGPDAACPGEPIELSATVQNCSDGPADITVSIDGEEETYPGVPAGESVTHVVERVMPQNCLGNSNVCFDVEYSATNDCGTTEGTPDEICVLCTRPSVQIVKSNDVPSEECVVNDNTVTYTLLVTNTGPVPVADIVVTDEISGYGYYVGGSASPAPASAPADGGQGTLRWEIAGPLAPGGTLEFTFDLTLRVPVCDGTYEYENYSQVTAYCAEAQAIDDDALITCIFCPGTCWMTTGGYLNCSMKQGPKEHNFGGNVGPPPHGSWQHVARDGNKIEFSFHSWDSEVINCFHDGNAGPCHPETDDNVIIWGGTGKYSIGNGKKSYAATFTARAEDHGEPGSQPDRDGGCGTPDWYWIEVRDAGTEAVVFTAEGYLDGGNVQIHKDVGNQDEGPAGGTTGHREEPRPMPGIGDGDMTSQIPLYRAFPNPFNHSTRIAFAVEGVSDARVAISVFDVSGRQIKELVNDTRSPGRYETSWDGRDTSGAQVPGGIYFFRVAVGNEVKPVSRILYLK